MSGNTKRQSRSHPTWTDVKKLADCDRVPLLDLIRSLYSAHKDNQVFLHSALIWAETCWNHIRKSLIETLA